MDTKIENELNRLGNEVNKYDKTTQSSSNIFTNIYFQKISIPFIVLLIVFIVVKPSFICDKNETTNVVLYKYENTTNFIHKETQFIFKDVNKNRIVIGKLIDKTIKDLEESDIKECKKWKFKYDKSKS